MQCANRLPRASRCSLPGMNLPTDLFEESVVGHNSLFIAVTCATCAVVILLIVLLLLIFNSPFERWFRWYASSTSAHAKRLRHDGGIARAGRVGTRLGCGCTHDTATEGATTFRRLGCGDGGDDLDVITAERVRLPATERSPQLPLPVRLLSIR